MVNLETGERDANESEVIPAGAGFAARTGTERGAGKEKRYPRRRTVRERMKRRAKNPGGRTTTGKNAGQHIRPGIVEAAEILIAEQYIVGKVIDPGSPFDLTGYRRDGTILLRVVRPKQSVANAADVRKAYYKEIREIEPWWKSDTDNIQFWVLSRENGLLRYRVFSGGIWNVSTMQKTAQKTHIIPPVQETATGKQEIRRMRDAPCNITPTGISAAPVSTPAQAGMSSKGPY
jgi:hypothetical protein